MNKHDFNKIIESINNIWLNNYIRVANKESVYNLAKEINEVHGVINTELSEPRQVNYKDFDGDESSLNVAYIKTDSEGYDYIEEIEDEKILKKAMEIVQDMMGVINNG